MELREIIEGIGGIVKATISKPKPNCEYKKISVTKTDKDYFVEMFTQRQVFHKHIKDINEFIISEGADFLQFNIWDSSFEHIILISKKGHISYKKKASACEIKTTSHNRKKKYLIEDGTVVPPLVDMGIFTREGKVVRQMYDKFRQINRFLELIDDEIRDRKFE